jgi:hypothetical protein
MKTQKHLLLLIVVAVSLTSFLGGYILTQGSRPASVLNEQRGALIDRFNGVVDTSTPTPLPPGLLQTTGDMVLAPTAAAQSDDVLYYHADTGTVSEIAPESRQATLISGTTLPGLRKVLWSADRNRVITQTNIRNMISFGYFDYTTHQHGSLGPVIEDVAISPDGQQVAIVRNPGSTAIQIADFNGTNPRTVLDTRLSNIRIFWPQPNLLAFIADDTDANTQSLYTLSTAGDLTQILSGVDHLQVKWSPSGTGFIYSEIEEGNQKTHLYSLISQEDHSLPISTAARLCAWTLNEQSVLCASETGGETSITKIDTRTFASSVLFSNLIASPQEVFLTHLEDFLMLTSAADQSLWQIKLSAN